MSQEPVLYSVEDGVCTITLNRPQVRNALDGPGLQALSDAWHRFKDDRDALVAIITGRGEKAFCAGMDLKAVPEDAGKDKAVEFSKWGQIGGFGIFPRQLFLGKPTIAAINGPALGVGGVLALQCDIKLATENATIGYNLVQIGMFPPYCHELWDLGPPSLALQSLLTGEPINARDAYRVGYVSEILPHADLMKRALEIATRIRDNAPLAVQAVKMAWDTDPRNTKLWSLHLFHDHARRVTESQDFREGPAAFAERRKPVFRGE